MVESLSKKEKNCLSPSLAYGQVSISQQIFGLVLRNSLVAKKKKKKKKIHLAFIWELSATTLHFHHPRGPPKGNRQEWGLGEEEGVFLSPGFRQLWRAWGALLVAQNRSLVGQNAIWIMFSEEHDNSKDYSGNSHSGSGVWDVLLYAREEQKGAFFSELSSLPFCHSGFSKHTL